MTTDETGTDTPVQRVPVTLDDIREIHDRTTWPAIQALKAQRDGLIREALAHGDIRMADIVADGMLSEGHLYRLQKGQTSGAQRPTEGPSRTERLAQLRAERTRLLGDLERVGGDLGVPLDALQARTRALGDRLERVEAELDQLEDPQ